MGASIKNLLIQIQTVRSSFIETGISFNDKKNTTFFWKENIIG